VCELAVIRRGSFLRKLRVITTGKKRSRRGTAEMYIELNQKKRNIDQDQKNPVAISKMSVYTQHEPIEMIRKVTKNTVSLIPASLFTSS